jgi:hypothetical protein
VLAAPGVYKPSQSLVVGLGIPLQAAVSVPPGITLAEISRVSVKFLLSATPRPNKNLTLTLQRRAYYRAKSLHWSYPRIVDTLIKGSSLQMPTGLHSLSMNAGAGGCRTPPCIRTGSSVPAHGSGNRSA